MSRRELQDWLIANEGFRRQFSDILETSVAGQFSALERPTVATTPPSWPYLLFCASILADSPGEECQDIALRIAQACMVSSDSEIAERDAAAIVLDDLANRLAIQLSESRERLQPRLRNRLGAATRIEWTRRTLANSVSLSDDTVIATNRFQRKFWKLVEQQGWISTSAPTSAGKSYIILQHVIDFFLKHPLGTVAYLVPTRALIHQVETDFRTLRQSKGLSNIAVSSIPLKNMLRTDAGNFFVFTQERLHLFLSAFTTIPQIDLIIIDEAHKVGDRQRGVLLQDVIERVTQSEAQIQVIFASPQTENPEILLSDAPTGASAAFLRSEDVTVNQNLIWANQVARRPRRWEISLCLADGLKSLGFVELPFNPTTSKRLPFVAHALAQNEGGNLVYVDGAADAEKTAQLLFDLLGRTERTPLDPELAELINLIKTAIHERYSLARTLERGVAFHYGNMPLIVRTEVERCFNEGRIPFLVCTSTLVEGVNLPCRNIFVRGPKKGRGQPMSEADFWNLAGRAGRWGREFQGNIICVDATNERVWPTGAPTQKRKYRIERTTDRVLQQPDDFITYLRNGMPAEEARRRPELEFIGSYLVGLILRAGSLANTPVVRRLDGGVLDLLDRLLREFVAGLSVEPQVIWRNPGISPAGINHLLSYFSGRKGPPEDLLPALPSSTDAVSNYIAVFTRINRELAPVFGSPQRIVMLSILVTEWMRGYPLNRLITERMRVLRERGRSAQLPSIIRQVMKDIEEVARFQAPKYISCYIDVLRQFLGSIERADLITPELDLNILLEFGVPGGTQLSLMGLGLSRTSALAISEYIAADNLTEDQCVAWLRSNTWQEFELPALVKREIRTILDLA